MTSYIKKFKENKKFKKNKRFKENTMMSLRVEDKQLSKNYNKVWKITERLMSIDFESKPFYGDDDTYIKTKIKEYARSSVITNFHNKKVSKEKIPCKCLSIIMLDSVIEVNENYYSQTFLEECKYVQEKIKFENYINDNLDSNSDDETKSDNDNDNDNDKYDG